MTDRLVFQDMASRPFASTLIYMSDRPRGDRPHQRPGGHAHGGGHAHPQRVMRLIKSTSQRELDPSEVEPAGVTRGLRLCPLALEPTRSGVAVVATFMCELPGTSATPTRACLASCLLTPRILHGSVHPPVKPSTSSSTATSQHRPPSSVT